MADEPERQDEPEPDPPEDEPGSGTDLKAEVEKWKARARQNEKRARAGAEAEQRLKEIEDQDKSELEKAQASAREWQQKAEAAELRANRAEVGVRKGLTASQAKRLQGTTPEELEADADELLADLRPQDKPSEEPSPNGNGRAARAPQPRLKPGAVPDAEPVETDPAKLAALITR